MLNLLTALYSKFSGSAFSADVGGRIFLDQAPQGTEWPYCVFFIVSANPDNAFAKKGRSVLIQFSKFSASSGAAEITTMYNDLHSLLDECSFTITSNVLILMKEINLTTMVEDVLVGDATQAVKHWATDFEAVTQES